MNPWINTASTSLTLVDEYLPRVLNSIGTGQTLLQYWMTTMSFTVSQKVVTLTEPSMIIKAITSEPSTLAISTKIESASPVTHLQVYFATPLWLQNNV